MALSFLLAHLDVVFLENGDLLRRETFVHFPSTDSSMRTGSQKVLSTHRIADGHVDNVLTATLLDRKGAVTDYQVAHVDETALIN